MESGIGIEPLWGGQSFPRNWAAISFTSLQRAFLSSKESAGETLHRFSHSAKPLPKLDQIGLGARDRRHGFDCLLSRLGCGTKKMEDKNITKERNSRHDDAPLHLPPEK